MTQTPKDEEQLRKQVTITLLKYHETEPHAYLEAAEIVNIILADRTAQKEALTREIGTAGAHACYCPYSTRNCNCALTDCLREQDAPQTTVMEKEDI